MYGLQWEERLSSRNSNINALKNTKAAVEWAWYNDSFTNAVVWP